MIKKYSFKLSQKIFLLSCLPLFLCCFSCTTEKKAATAETEDELLVRARTIHNDVITLDTHCDINVNNFTDSINYTQDLDTQVTLPKMKEGGLDVAWFIVYTGQDTLTDEGYQMAYENAISKFDAIHKLVEEIAPDEIELATTSDDVRRIVKAGKKVAMIGVENGYPIGTDIKRVEEFYNRGARYMSLAHNGHSQLADSNTGEKDSIWLNNGVSDLGKEVVKEMNRLGMMIDVSHPSKEAMKQMVALSKAPIIASHSSARALGEHSRNLDDEQLELIKENGGVVQAVAFRSYVNPEKDAALDKYRTEIGKEIMDSLGYKWVEREDFHNLSPAERVDYFAHYHSMSDLRDKKMATIDSLPPAVNVSDFVDHIDYMVDLIGIEHVGISSDFDGGGGVEGWNDASQTFNVTLELVRRGYTEDEIAKLWSGNLLRVLDEVQSIAENIQEKNKEVE
ncbi:dipeptidase [Leeuwenhoekiella sp. A2]|uniref:dipeptidase n=1 Tax=Leeuwenhoekiella sp. A2 TaxID=3141460 RepID=UPI003A8044AD